MKMFFIYCFTPFSSTQGSRLLMQLSYKYEVERMELKAKITDYKEQLQKLAESNRNKESFIADISKFMEMNEITPALLKELVEKIECTKPKESARTAHSV